MNQPALRRYRLVELAGMSVRSRTAIFALSVGCLCGTVFPQAATVQKDDWVLTTKAKFEIWRDKAAADVQRYDGEIQKCDGIMSRLENIIKLAREQDNAKAEATAREAANKARLAKEKYLALKKAKGRDKARAEAALAAIRSANKGFEAAVEQVWKEINPDGWVADQAKRIQERLGSANRWVEDFIAAREKGGPQLPAKKLGELQPGDVLLFEGKAISSVDNAFSVRQRDMFSKLPPDTPTDGTVSKASHTVLYLREVNGKKLFLDNQPGEGPLIISEDEFLRRYGHRGAEVARLVGQPLSQEQTDRLFREAVKKAQENTEKVDKNQENIMTVLGTNYGAWGKNNTVCSEADWAVLNFALKDSGREIPKTDDRFKSFLGIDFSPADYLNCPYFLVTPLTMPKSPGQEQ